MTADRETLLALAERCEATPAHYQGRLLLAVWEELYGVYPDAGDWDQPYEARRFGEMVDVKAYVSAAMTLVPEGWVWSINTFGEPNKSASAYLMSARNEQVRPARQYIATPALALTAACLRAIASQEVK